MPINSNVSHQTGSHLVSMSLRKGRTLVYFSHPDTGHSIGAEDYRCELVESELVISFTLRPIDGNQRHDLGYTLEHPIEYVEISDSHILNGLAAYYGRRKPQVQSWRVNINSKRGSRSLVVTPRSTEFSAQFHVEGI